jgi:hypothetical protein
MEYEVCNRLSSAVKIRFSEDLKDELLMIRKLFHFFHDKSDFSSDEGTVLRNSRGWKLRSWTVKRLFLEFLEIRYSSHTLSLFVVCWVAGIIKQSSSREAMRSHKLFTMNSNSIIIYYIQRFRALYHDSQGVDFSLALKRISL